MLSRQNIARIRNIRRAAENRKRLTTRRRGLTPVEATMATSVLLHPDALKHEEKKEEEEEETKDEGIEFLCCPHCNGAIEIESLNCGIFRHAVFKHNNVSIPPHSPQASCEKLVKQGLVRGCAKPFKVVKKGDHFIVEPCLYV